MTQPKKKAEDVFSQPPSAACEPGPTSPFDSPEPETGTNVDSTDGANDDGTLTPKAPDPVKTEAVPPSPQSVVEEFPFHQYKAGREQTAQRALPLTEEGYAFMEMNDFYWHRWKDRRAARDRHFHPINESDHGRLFLPRTDMDCPFLDSDSTEAKGYVIKGNVNRGAPELFLVYRSKRASQSEHIHIRKMSDQKTDLRTSDKKRQAGLSRDTIAKNIDGQNYEDDFKVVEESLQREKRLERWDSFRGD